MKYLLSVLCFSFGVIYYLNGQSPIILLGCDDSGHHDIEEALPFFPKVIDYRGYSEFDRKAANLLSDYIKVPSIQPQDDRAANHIISIARDLGLYTQEYRAPDSSLTVAVSIFPLSMNKPNIVLLNHTDIVEAYETSNWLHPPFEGVIDRGFVWGRGAYDNKGSAITQILALAEVAKVARSEDWSINYTALSLPGEETFHYYGAEYFVSHHFDELNVYAAIGEGPAGLKGLVSKAPDSKVFGISVSHKRALWLRLSLEFESTGHGSVPPINYPSKDMVLAIDQLLSYKQPIILNEFNTTMLQELGDLEGGVKGFFIKNIHFFRPFAKSTIRKEPMYNAFFSNTISLTDIRTSSLEPNSIPDRVEAILDCRLLPGYDTHDFINLVKEQLGNDNISIEIIRETPDASPTLPNHPVYRFIENSIKAIYEDAAVIPVMLQSTTDSNFFREKGVPVFSTVPILMTTDLLKRVHSNNERVPIISLGKAIEIWSDFMINFSHYFDDSHFPDRNNVEYFDSK